MLKHDISEVINIFTSEDMENTIPKSWMWFHMNFSAVFSNKNTCVYIIIAWM